MKSNKSRILVYLLALLPVLLLTFLYRQLPEQIPTHWNLDGTVTYSVKANSWLLVLIGPVLAVLFDIMPKIDPRRNNYRRFGKYYDGFCIFMMIFLFIMNGITLSEAFYPGKISVSKTIMLLLSVLFIFMGNIMPKIKSNFYFGIKTPWTLSNEDIWCKTHRLTGQLFFWSGFVLLFATFLVSDLLLFSLLLIVVFTCSLLPMLMSYLWYQKLETK